MLWYCGDSKNTFLNFQITYEVINSNFFTAEVKDLSVQITWDNFVVSENSEKSTFNVVSVPARSTKKVGDFITKNYDNYCNDDYYVDEDNNSNKTM
mgnify:FL=1